MANFRPVSRAEISTRVLKEILVKRQWRLHREGFCPGWISARAENVHPGLEGWKTSCNRSKISAQAHWRMAAMEKLCLKCIWSKNQLKLMWKAFQNVKRRCFPFCDNFSRSRDIPYFVLCKLDNWWGHKLFQYGAKTQTGEYLCK